MADEKRIIESARNQIERDPHLAIYMVRDLEISKRANVANACWVMSRDGSATMNDARWVLDELDKLAASEEADDGKDN